MDRQTLRDWVIRFNEQGADGLMINLREGRFPHYNATDMDAERRLFYVAVTRAERILMYIAEPDQWGNPPSRFLGRDGVGLV